MKKTLALILTLALSLAALTGCGSKTETPADTNTDNSAQTEAPATLSGSVSTNGSTSMEKVSGGFHLKLIHSSAGLGNVDLVGVLTGHNSFSFSISYMCGSLGYRKHSLTRKGSAMRK